ncbi:kinetochore Sim4 complex subunit Fta4 [Podospora australis]|uniref:Kinetochore Sim4 complex subunit Fta4 n=1 Tax=Podospora australis TaxID=1536484 RepID=A0AAN7ALX0_9PEZI|nr:kinetochore Sim4 complex subunit Fta4 [Podospora australis]
MASNPPTIITLKQTFLQTQTRTLSQPLAPSRSWRNSNSNFSPDASSNNQDGQRQRPIPEKQLDDALQKLNHRLAQHCRRVYAPQTTRHIAEQLDALYYSSSASAVPDDGDDEEAGLEGVGVNTASDLADEKIISSLPSTWESQEQEEKEREKYAELVSQLNALNQQRKETESRLAKLHHLQSLLQPFVPAQENVQQNLVTKNGEIEEELSKMRMLLARVGGRVGALVGEDEGNSSSGSLFSERDGSEDKEKGDRMEGVEMSEKKKVEGLLGLF